MLQLVVTKGSQCRRVLLLIISQSSRLQQLIDARLCVWELIMVTPWITGHGSYCTTDPVPVESPVIDSWFNLWTHS